MAPGEKIDLATKAINRLLSSNVPLLEPLTREHEAVKFVLERMKFISMYWERRCVHCKGMVHEPYMVHDHVWLAVMSSKEGALHLACLERRLGRFLRIEDFQEDSSINASIFLGYRMALP